MAREFDLWLVPGSLYESRDGRIYNTTPVIDPNGGWSPATARCSPSPRSRRIAPGDEFCVFEVPDVGKFAVLNCYDLWFPGDGAHGYGDGGGGDPAPGDDPHHRPRRRPERGQGQCRHVPVLSVRHQRPGCRRQRPVLRARPVGPGDPPVRHHRGAGAGRGRSRAGAAPARARHADPRPAAQELPRQPVHFPIYDGARGLAYLDSLGPLEKPQRGRLAREPGRSSPWRPNDRGDVPGGRRGPARGALLEQFERTWPAYRPGTCAKARRRGPPSSSAGACCASICPS